MTSDQISTDLGADALLRSLEDVRERVEDLRLPLQVPDVDMARRDRGQLLDQLEDYLLPRLRQLDAVVGR